MPDFSMEEEEGICKDTCQFRLQYQQANYARYMSHKSPRLIKRIYLRYYVITEIQYMSYLYCQYCVTP